MRIVVGAWFTLPRLGNAAFSTLMKQNVSYDRALGFKMDAATDVEGAVKVLSEALGEPVELALRCIVCGREACPGCPYSSFCDRAKVSSLCLCGEHSGEGAFEAYQKKFLENLPA